jgi:uncharacterized protein (DUF1330 family)
MPVYMIANIELDDAERYKDYVAHVPALIARHGGKYRVRGGQSHVLEGTWSPSRLIVLEFPSREAAMAFYDDPDYAPYKSLRQSIARSSVVLVDGYE